MSPKNSANGSINPTKNVSASNSCKILHLNTRSIKKHYEELEALISCFESPPSIICLTESWLTNVDDPNLFKVTKYNTCLSKSRVGRGGGIMIQMRDEVSLIEELNCDLDESLLAHLKIGDLKIALLVYNPPRANKQNFIFELDNTLENLNDSYDRIIVCGDFNINVLDTNRLTSTYLSTLRSNGFELSFLEPTRISQNTETCLDHFFVKNLKVQKAFVMENQSYCDHLPTVLQIETNNGISFSQTRFRDTSFLKSPKKMALFIETLSESLATIKYQEVDDVDNAFQKFEIAFNQVFEVFAPYRIPNGNRTGKPIWFDKTLKNLICKRNQLHKTWKKDKKNRGKIDKFKGLRTKVEKTIKAKKKHYYEQIFLKCIGDSKQVYKFINELKGVTSKNTNIPSLSKKGKRVEDHLAIANELNNFFVNIGPNLKDAIPKEVFVRPKVNSSQSMWLYQTNCDEIIEVINDLKGKSSSRIDDISTILIKETKSLTCKNLVYLINTSFKFGKFPSKLKRAKIVPLHKAGAKDDVNNYRPISLLIVWSKIFERIMYNRIYTYFETFDLFNPNQFGFRKKHSTIDAIAKLTETIRENSNLEVITFLLT